MPKHVGFLRAVNLGRRRVPMAKLVDVVAELGHGDVWTFVNSGNVVFDATGSRAKLEQGIEAGLEQALGFEVTTFVRTAAELRRALALEPFDLAAGDTYFVTFLKDRLPAAKAKALEALGNDFDTLVVRGRDVHWHMRGPSTETTLTTKQWAGVAGHHRSTSRNMNMLRRLAAKMEA
ncbi:MAG TPA: DUF1697 domain-containing protein [Acidimicrobiales bacterium]|nr:DUF1697 domain-containing protein [Acidimicrobiales bacterium]